MYDAIRIKNALLEKLMFNTELTPCSSPVRHVTLSSHFTELKPFVWG